MLLFFHDATQSNTLGRLDAEHIDASGQRLERDSVLRIGTEENVATEVDDINMFDSDTADGYATHCGVGAGTDIGKHCGRYGLCG